MNERPELSRLAMGLLADEPVDVAPPSAEDEARAIEAIAKAIEASRARKRRRTIALAAAGVIAFAAGFVGIRLVGHSQQPTASNAPGHPAADPTVSVAGYAISGEVRVVHDGRDAPLGDGAKVLASDRIVAKAGRASLSFSTGTHVVVEQGSDVTLAEGGLVQRFELRSGAVRADVAKLRTGERFVVRTDDTEVEVRGTSFRVAVVPKHTCGVPSATDVSVTEGRVWVRFAGQEVVLAAGESWPPSCTTKAEPAAIAPTVAVPAQTGVTLLAPPQQGFGRPAPHAQGGLGSALSPVAAASVTTSRPPPAADTATTADVPPLPASELTEQNRAFEEALGAKRRGDAQGALGGFERFLAKYPKSPLVESAMAERMRILASTDEARARDAATQYLERFPSGFAAAEARAVLARSR